MTEQHLLFHERLELREPILLAAFSGWNDAGQSATFALSALQTAWQARRIAEIDPDVFFDFSESRPIVSLTPTGQRSLTWPENAFYGQSLGSAARDVVLLIGAEPQLRWRAFCALIVDVARQVGASALVTVGSLLADVPHTVEPRITGFSTEKGFLPALHELGAATSSYEGPTGIVGALHECWQATGLPAASLWGHVPHYISASPNPQVALALLRRVGAILGISLPVAIVEPQAEVFRRRVDEALEGNAEALEYVRQLETQYGVDPSAEVGPELIEELEDYLRGLRPGDEGE